MSARKARQKLSTLGTRHFQRYLFRPFFSSSSLLPNSSFSFTLENSKSKHITIEGDRQTDQLNVSSPYSRRHKSTHRESYKQLKASTSYRINSNQDEDIYAPHCSLRTRPRIGAESLWTASLCFTLPLLRHHSSRLRPRRPRLPMRHRQSQHPSPRRDVPHLGLQRRRSRRRRISRKRPLRSLLCNRHGLDDRRCHDHSDEYRTVVYDGEWLGDDYNCNDEFG